MQDHEIRFLFDPLIAIAAASMDYTGDLPRLVRTERFWRIKGRHSWRLVSITNDVALSAQSVIATTKELIEHERKLDD